VSTRVDDAIQVAFAADANYVMPLTVAICSAALNCNRQRRLEFSVIEKGIGPDLRTKVESSLARTGFPHASIRWLQAGDQIGNLKIAHHYLTSLTYGKLLIPTLLSEEVEKAIYLDCDLVVNGDLGELWDTDLRDKSLLAVRDRIGFVDAPGGISNYRELGIAAGAKYFNAGVLVINLAKWRQEATDERVFSYMRLHRDIIKMEDQEGLNAVLFDDWDELDFRWNWQIPWRGYRRGRNPMPWLPAETGQRRIVHFTSSEKPWLPGCDYEEKKCFFEYLDRTEWVGWRVSPLNEIVSRTKRAIDDARDFLGRLRSSRR